MQQIGFLLQKLIVNSTCFGHHYTHHQELQSIIQVVYGMLQTGHITYSSTPDQQPVNQSTKYHRQQPPV